uniref:Uncharacterized protein n=1 Tax=Nelumbo nucifera TaxID=4432 RepID=A0A822XDU3_NELNU|nr:TPA_asm: hypothetical protein HUJ06_019810 [Nelumbo nucifera]
MVEMTSILSGNESLVSSENIAQLYV